MQNDKIPLGMIHEQKDKIGFHVWKGDRCQTYLTTIYRQPAQSNYYQELCWRVTRLLEMWQAYKEHNQFYDDITHNIEPFNDDYRLEPLKFDIPRPVMMI